MMGPFGDDTQVQLIAVDHTGLFETVLWACQKVATKGADRAILHRAALSSAYRADPDEVNRLRAVQRRLRDVDVEGRDAMLDELERQIAIEHGEGRSAAALAKMELWEVRDCAIRWSVIGKRGAPIRVSSELLGVLQRLFEDDVGDDGFPDCLHGTEDPVDHEGDPVFAPSGLPMGPRHAYRPPASVAALAVRLDAVDRPTLDAAIDAVVGTHGGAEEKATWLEDDVEALTDRYRHAASGQGGLWYRFS